MIWTVVSVQIFLFFLGGGGLNVINIRGKKWFDCSTPKNITIFISKNTRSVLLNHAEASQKTQIANQEMKYYLKQQTWIQKSQISARASQTYSNQHKILPTACASFQVTGNQSFSLHLKAPVSLSGKELWAATMLPLSCTNTLPTSQLFDCKPRQTTVLGYSSCSQTPRLCLIYYSLSAFCFLSIKAVRLGGFGHYFIMQKKKRACLL